MNVNSLEMTVALASYEPKLSILLPAYNEADVLKQNVESIEKVAAQIAHPFEIVIAEDGCSDETPRIACDISNNSSRVIHLHSNHRLGKGMAIREAFKASQGQIVVFMDADLSTSLDHLHDVVKLVENGYDAVIGSRYARGSFAKRPVFRTAASKAYNFLVRLLFQDGVLDHQCGFKGFNRRVLKDILDEVTEDGFSFDTELILRMKRKKLRVIEIPVNWTEIDERTSKFRLLTDGILMGLKLFKLKLRLQVP